jgi:hypothetical protein
MQQLGNRFLSRAAKAARGFLKRETGFKRGGEEEDAIKANYSIHGNG